MAYCNTGKSWHKRLHKKSFQTITENPIQSTKIWEKKFVIDLIYEWILNIFAILFLLNVYYEYMSFWGFYQTSVCYQHTEIWYIDYFYASGRWLTVVRRKYFFLPKIKFWSIKSLKSSVYRAQLSILQRNFSEARLKIQFFISILNIFTFYHKRLTIFYNPIFSWTISQNHIFPKKKITFLQITFFLVTKRLDSIFRSALGFVCRSACRFHTH
jgi:hypothetical protein